MILNCACAQKRNGLAKMKEREEKVVRHRHHKNTKYIIQNQHIIHL